MCNTPEHTFLLSSGQTTTERFKAREAKYGKFAYSSSFGFNVPCGNFLEQLAPESILAVCVGVEEENWKLYWDPIDITSEEMSLGGETVPTLTSSWRPWKGKDVVTRTTFTTPVKRWSGWSQRVHRVTWKSNTTDVSSR